MVILRSFFGFLKGKVVRKMVPKMLMGLSPPMAGGCSGFGFVKKLLDLFGWEIYDNDPGVLGISLSLNSPTKNYHFAIYDGSYDQMMDPMIKFSLETVFHMPSHFGGWNFLNSPSKRRKPFSRTTRVTLVSGIKSLIRL